MIPIEQEPDGLEPLECCVFCESPTRWWYVKANAPVCQTCSPKFLISNVPTVSQLLARCSDIKYLAKGEADDYS